MIRYLQEIQSNLGPLAVNSLINAGVRGFTIFVDGEIAIKVTANSSNSKLKVLNIDVNYGQISQQISIQKEKP